jgi:beta-glucosidase
LSGIKHDKGHLLKKRSIYTVQKHLHLCKNSFEEEHYMSIEINLKELLHSMTVKEKIFQLFQLGASYYTKDKSEITGPMDEMGIEQEDLSMVGSSLGVMGASTMINIQKKYMKNNPNGIPMIFMKDVIHGFRTVYPIPLALGCGFDEDLVYDCSRMAAVEASAGGIHVTFTPMVDCIRDVRWGRVMESCGEDPYLNSIMGAAQVRAFQGDDISKPGNIAACVKHFAAYGAGESGRDYNNVEISERMLRTVHFPAYKACVDAGVKMLMPSFNNLNGVPSVANKWLMNDILRDEWNYKGLVISDYAAVNELIVHGVAANPKEAARLTFDAGCDIEMMSSAYANHLEELINEGIFTMEQLDSSVMKVLELKNELGLFDDPYHGASVEKEAELCLCKEHRAIALRAAEETAVLLKNDGVLPFKKTIKKLALIGPFAKDCNINGAWSGSGRSDESVSVKEGIESLVPDTEIYYAKGCGMLFEDTDTSGFKDAVDLAKSADAVVLCIGESFKYSGEGCSRAKLGLPGAQLELLREVAKVNPNLVVVLFGGRPLVLTELSEIAPAILHMWFPGTEGGNACARLIFGDSNPCGKLSVSFPKSVGQCPLYYNRTNTGRPKSKPDGVYEPFVSNYIDSGNLPLYFFGYGLSYTEFEYKSMTLTSREMKSDSSIRILVTLKNVGKYPGKETVQLYIRDMVSSAVRPVQELVSFKKIQLECGEEKTVEFEITEPMLRFWNSKNEFVSEKGEFTISVGYADHMYLSEKFVLI